MATMKPRKMISTIEFGKVAFTGKRKSFPVSVLVELVEGDVCDAFMATAYVWNPKRDRIKGKVDLDVLLRHLRANRTFRKIYRLWKVSSLCAADVEDARELFETGVSDRSGDVDKE